FRLFLDAGAYDVMMPDVKYVGGISAMIELAEDMRIGGCTFSPHNPSGPVCHAASLHVCAAATALQRLEMQFDETPLFDSLAVPRLSVPRDGAAPVPLDRGGVWQ
ncbi:MAG: hypothetical protein JO122_16765, partial [Acetobacteraceae bacterium]|nr:hypothetical protein [Acetobacteraceae bacterium]